MAPTIVASPNPAGEGADAFDLRWGAPSAESLATVDELLSDITGSSSTPTTGTGWRTLHWEGSTLVGDVLAEESADDTYTDDRRAVSNYLVGLVGQEQITVEDAAEIVASSGDQSSVYNRLMNTRGGRRAVALITALSLLGPTATPAVAQNPDGGELGPGQTDFPNEDFPTYNPTYGIRECNDNATSGLVMPARHASHGNAKFKHRKYINLKIDQEPVYTLANRLGPACTTYGPGVTVHVRAKQENDKHKMVVNGNLTIKDPTNVGIHELKKMKVKKPYTCEPGEGKRKVTFRAWVTSNFGGIPTKSRATMLLPGLHDQKPC